MGRLFMDLEICCFIQTITRSPLALIVIKLFYKKMYEKYAWISTTTILHFYVFGCFKYDCPLIPRCALIHLTHSKHLAARRQWSPPRLLEETWKTGKVLKWFLMSDLSKTSYKQDKTSSQTISLIVESNCYKTKQGLT